MPAITISLFRQREHYRFVLEPLHYAIFTCLHLSELSCHFDIRRFAIAPTLSAMPPPPLRCRARAMPPLMPIFLARRFSAAIRYFVLFILSFPFVFAINISGHYTLFTPERHYWFYEMSFRQRHYATTPRRRHIAIIFTPTLRHYFIFTLFHLFDERCQLIAPFAADYFRCRHY